MKTNRRFVEDVKNALEAGADLGRETDALGLAAGESVGGASELEIAETDVLHEFYAFADFF